MKPLTLKSANKACFFQKHMVIFYISNTTHSHFKAKLNSNCNAEVAMHKQ